MIDNRFIEIIEGNFNSNDDLPRIIVLLKDTGASQIDTMTAIRQYVDIRIRELDNLILNSPAWSHLKNTNLKLRDDFLDNR